LAERALPFSRHPRVHQNLSDSVLGALRRFGEVGLVHGLNEIERVVVRDELESVRNAGNKVFFFNDIHNHTIPEHATRFGAQPPLKLLWSSGCGNSNIPFLFDELEARAGSPPRGSPQPIIKGKKA
jgi:hypothetical protein